MVSQLRTRFLLAGCIGIVLMCAMGCVRARTRVIHPLPPPPVTDTPPSGPAINEQVLGLLFSNTEKRDDAWIRPILEQIAEALRTDPLRSLPWLRSQQAELEAAVKQSGSAALLESWLDVKRQADQAVLRIRIPFRDLELPLTPRRPAGSSVMIDPPVVGGIGPPSPTPPSPPVTRLDPKPDLRIPAGSRQARFDYQPSSSHGRLMLLSGLGIGLILLLLVLAIAVVIPKPTDFQLTVFRATLAASLASIATALGWSVTRQTDDNPQLAGPVTGGLAVFLVVYLLSPVWRPKRFPAPTDTGEAELPGPQSAAPPAAGPAAPSAARQPPEAKTSSALSGLPSPTAQPNSIFICYRRLLAAHCAGRIREGLVERFGPEAVFRDHDNIPLGSDYRVVLNDAVQTCKVMVAIIAPGWESVTDSDTGALRLAQDNDYVRIEIATALTRNISLIPVLVEGASLPAPDTLPGAIKDVVFRQHITVRQDPDFVTDLERLTNGIAEILSVSGAPAAAPLAHLARGGAVQP